MANQQSKTTENKLKLALDSYKNTSQRITEIATSNLFQTGNNTHLLHT